MKVDLKSVLRSATPEQRMRLRDRLGAERPADVAELPPPIERAPRDGPLPLSFVEERHFFLEQLSPGESTYNTWHALRLRGQLDEPALAGALDALVARHESLRTRYVAEGPSAKRVIDAPAAVPIARHSVRTLAGGARLPEAERIALAEATRPFDLAHGPLARVALIELDDADHVLLLAFHHIVVDGVSLGTIETEIATLYETLHGGATSPLAPLDLQYADYAAWQRAWVSGERLAAKVDRWKRRLDGVPPLALPTDRPRLPFGASSGAAHAFELPAGVLASLRELGRREHVTPFVVLFSAFAATLGRYANQTDFAIGTALVNRPNVRLEPLVGFFANEVPIRIDLSGRPTGRELLARLRARMLEASDEGDVPLDHLVRALRPARDPSRSPIFQVDFQSYVMNEAATDVSAWKTLAMERLALERPRFGMDLTAVLGIGGAALSMLEYATSLFDASTVARISDSFVMLLEGLLADPDRRVPALPIVGDADRRAFVSWNATDVDYGEETTVLGRIEARAAEAPNAPAVIAGGERLTYAELGARANRLARHLRGLGVAPEVKVAICLERSADLVVSLLAVLKAGGAYVPFDPSYPHDRLRYMLEDASPKVLLTHSSLEGALAPGDVAVVRVDERARWENEAPGDLGLALDPRALAYMIYTSGSTGRPKGALNTHGGLLNRLLWMQSAYGLDASDAVLQKTPFSFDVSVWEFFWPLMFGARLVVAAPEGHRDPAYLANLIATEGVTTIHFVPSMLQAFLAEPTVDRCVSLRRVFCSGEALAGPLAARYYERLGAPLHNLYGPTEAAIDVSAWPCARNEPDVVPIGRPIANTRLYVVDREQQIVPVGVSGELCIGGVQLGRGYANRPELTADKFVPDPFAGGGARMYRTGDVARWRSDGTLEFLGRNDDQVKIRGFRIELGEIEAALLAQPGVRQAAVLARRDRGGDARLVGYVAGEAAPGLREALRQTLPEHMVPSTIVSLPELPLNANGKLDRKALPAPEAAPSETPFVAPRSELEASLCRAFADLLAVPRVGVDDDFFELGGHSLLAMRLVANLRSELETDVPMRVVFEGRTVAGIAQRIEASASGGAAPRLERGEGDEPAPLSPQQLTMWHWERAHPTNRSRNIVFGTWLRGALDEAAFERAVGEELRRQGALRTTFRVIDGEPKQVVLPPGGGLERIGAENVAPEARARFAEDLAEDLWSKPVLVEGGRLFRAIVVRFAQDDHLLLVVTHHSAVDAPHAQRFVIEVLAVYDAFAAGRASPLADPPVQYTDYARWRLAMLERSEIAAQRAYWKDKLRGAQPVALPFSRPPPPAAARTAGRRAIELPIGSVFPRVAELAVAESVSPVAVFSALLLAYLARVAHAKDVTMLALNTMAQGDSKQLAPLLGCFLDFLVIRTSVDGDLSLRELVRRVWHELAAALRNGAVPAADMLDDPGIFDHPCARALLNVVAEWASASDPREGRLPGAEPGPRRLGPRVTELVWTVWLPSQRAELRLSSDTFDEPAAERLGRALTRLVQQAVAEPDAPLATLRLDD